MMRKMSDGTNSSALAGPSREILSAAVDKTERPSALKEGLHLLLETEFTLIEYRPQL